MNYHELKTFLRQELGKSGIEADSDIDWILADVTGKKRSMLPFTQFSTSELEKIYAEIELRKAHIPIDYIFGKMNFFGREFKVTRDTLIPRLDTEVLIENIIKFAGLNAEKTVLDIGTGSGIIAITVEMETGAKVLGVDISENAVEVARENAEKLGSAARFEVSDIFSAVDEKYDVIVSNPPYIRSGEIENLDPEVKDFEPRLALDGGADGLDYYRKITESSLDYLKDFGMIFFEIGYDQAEDVKKLLDNKFENIVVVKDYSGNDRVVFATKRKFL